MTFGAATQAKIDEIVVASERHGTDSIIVLSGVAGTGKTCLALAAAQKYAKHPFFVKQIQFHQSFSYEDFVEGLRPTAAGGFEPRSGIFLEWNEAALRDPGNQYVLLVEEFTRANITAVLGELMTYIEYRDRLFETPLTRRRIKVASNITIIATMNPQDRTALEVDDALIRRLRIVECPPSTMQLREMLDGVKQDIVDRLAALFDECQKKHPDTFNDLMPFGHGMFAGVKTEQDLTRLWHQRIKHLLRRNPQVPAHTYSRDIEGLYPWRNSTAAGEAREN